MWTEAAVMPWVLSIRRTWTLCKQEEMTLLTCSCTDRVLVTVTPRIFMTSTRLMLARGRLLDTRFRRLYVNTISWNLARLRVKFLKVNTDLKSGIKPKLHCTTALNYPFTTLIIHYFIPLSSCSKGFHLTNPSTVTSLLSSRPTQRTVYSEPYRFLFYLFTVCKQPKYQQAALVWACAAKR